VHARKVAALKEHASQFAYHDMLHVGLALGAQRAMYLSKEARYGEAFAPLGEPHGADRELLPRSS
jgi:LmbE family N-acetylglucosaminyl deacetylase